MERRSERAESQGRASVPTEGGSLQVPHFGGVCLVGVSSFRRARPPLPPPATAVTKSRLLDRLL